MATEAFKNKAAFRWSVDSPDIKVIPISAAAHSIEPIPGTKHLSIASPKNSNVLSLLDWSEGVEVATLKQPEGSFYYGHCGFDSAVSAVIAGSWHQSGVGAFTICDIKNLKRLETISIPFGRPHQMVKISDREFLVGIFNNSEYKSLLAIVDINSGKVEPFFLDYQDSQQRVVGHFVRIDSSRVCWTANTHGRNSKMHSPSLVVFNEHTRSAEIHRFEGELARGSISSSMYDPVTRTIWFTMSELKSVFQFSLERREVVRQVRMPITAWGLSAHPESPYIYATSDYAIWRIDRHDSTAQIVKVAETNGVAAMHTSWREG